MKISKPLKRYTKKPFSQKRLETTSGTRFSAYSVLELGVSEVSGVGWQNVCDTWPDICKFAPNGFDFWKSEGSEFDKESNHPGERFRRPDSDDIRFS